MAFLSLTSLYLGFLFSYFICLIPVQSIFPVYLYNIVVFLFYSVFVICVFVTFFSEFYFWYCMLLRTFSSIIRLTEIQTFSSCFFFPSLSCIRERCQLHFETDCGSGICYQVEFLLSSFICFDFVGYCVGCIWRGRVLNVLLFALHKYQAQIKFSFEHCCFICNPPVSCVGKRQRSLSAD